MAIDERVNNNTKILHKRKKVPITKTATDLAGVYFPESDL